MTAVIGWRFAYVIRTTYKWWVEVCANGKQEVATGCFHRWSGHELTPLHRPISLSLSLLLTRISLFLSLYLSLSFSLFLPPTSRVLAFPSSTISPPLPIISSTLLYCYSFLAFLSRRPHSFFSLFSSLCLCLCLSFFIRSSP